jgi:hypothetical protein
MARYSISTDRQQRMDGLTRIWDEHTNRYVTDANGAPLTFVTPHDAEAWLEGEWLRSIRVQA